MLKKYSIGIEAKDAEIVPCEEDQRMPETYFDLDANAGNDVQHFTPTPEKKIKCWINAKRQIYFRAFRIKKLHVKKNWIRVAPDLKSL